MAFTYSDDPATSDRDNLRFTIGDTDSGNFFLNDAELDFLLVQRTTVKGAAVEAVRRIIALVAKQVTKAVGDLRLNLSDRLKNYKQLLKELQTSLALGTAGPVVGGISRSRKNTVEENDDRVIPDFEKGQFDHPGVGNVTNLDDRLIE